MSAPACPAWLDEGLPNPSAAWPPPLADEEIEAQARRATSAMWLLDRRLTKATKGGGHGGASPNDTMYEVRRHLKRRNEHVLRMKAARRPIDRAAEHGRWNDTCGAGRGAALLWLEDKELIDWRAGDRERLRSDLESAFAALSPSEHV